MMPDGEAPPGIFYSTFTERPTDSLHPGFDFLEHGLQRRLVAHRGLEDAGVQCLINVYRVAELFQQPGAILLDLGKGMNVAVPIAVLSERKDAGLDTGISIQVVIDPVEFGNPSFLSAA